MGSNIYRLLRHLGVRGALLGLAVLVIVPTVVSAIKDVHRNQQQVVRTQEAAHWNEALQPLRDATRQMALHRGLTSRILNGDDNPRPARLKARIRIKDLLAQAESLIPPGTGTADALTRFRARWAQIERSADAGAMAPRDVFGAHTQLIARIHSAVRSALGRDLNTLPEHVMLLGELQMNLARAAEYTGQIRGLGAGYVASQGADGSVPGDIRVLGELANALVSSIGENPALSRDDALAGSVTKAVTALASYTVHAHEVMSAPQSTTGAAYFDQGTQIIKGLSGR